LKIITPGVIWITGLSASGKSTLAEGFYRKLKKLKYQNVVLLDGEDLRKHSSRVYGYSLEERAASSLEDISIVKSFYDQGKFVILSTISPQRSIRAHARKMFTNFYEVFLDCSVEICSKRDYKGHYAKALSGELKNFVGIDQTYEVSDDPELTINTDEKNISQTLEALFNFSKKQNIVIKNNE